MGQSRPVGERLTGADPRWPWEPTTGPALRALGSLRSCSGGQPGPGRADPSGGGLLRAGAELRQDPSVGGLYAGAGLRQDPSGGGLRRAGAGLRQDPLGGGAKAGRGD